MGCYYYRIFKHRYREPYGRQVILERKWNESGFRPPLCTYRLNWARRISWGIYTREYITDTDPEHIPNPILNRRFTSHSNTEGGIQVNINPLTAKLFNWDFHPLEVVSRWRDPQLQVSENYTDLRKWRPAIFKSRWLMSHFIFNKYEM